MYTKKLTDGWFAKLECPYKNIKNECKNIFKKPIELDRYQSMFTSVDNKGNNNKRSKRRYKNI